MYTLTDQPLANATNHDDPAVCTVECQTYVTVELLEAREKELAEKRLEVLESCKLRSHLLGFQL